MKNKGMLIVASMFAVLVATSLSQAAPSCCDPSRSTAGTVALAPSPQMLRAMPLAPLTVEVPRQRPRTAVATGPQSRWIVPAAATAAMPSYRVASGSGSALPPCCTQAGPSNVPRQAGCCGGAAPQGTPQTGGCCGNMAPGASVAPPSCCGPAGPNVAAPQQGCCGGAKPGCAPRGGGCCGKPGAAPVYPQQGVRRSPGLSPAPGSCCTPGSGSATKIPGITRLPEATPISRVTGYAGPTPAGQIRPATRAVQPSVNRPTNRPIPIEPISSSFSYAQPGGLW